MLAIPDEHLLKFHACKGCKSPYEKLSRIVLRIKLLLDQSNAPQLYYEYLEQINLDDLEEMDLKWQVAMLTMRVKRFIKKTGRKMDLNDKETVGFDRTKVECYNYHRRGHFARECRAPRNQGNRNRDAPRRNAPVHTSTTNALVVQDGIGYQMGLESLEARIVVHEKNKAVYEEYIAFLKYDVQHESDGQDNTENDYGLKRLNESVFWSAMRKTTASVPETETSISKTSKDIVEKPKTVRPSAPIIEEWDTDNDNCLDLNLIRQNQSLLKSILSNLRIVYPPVLNINYFHHFLDILRNYDPMDDEPMWAADHVVALTLGLAITIPETANEFAIKGNHLTLVKGNQFDGRTQIDPHKHIHEFLRICDMFKYRDTENEAVCLMMFPLSLTGEAKTWLDILNEGTIKTWDELRTAFISRFFPPALFDRLLGEIRAFSQHENESLTDAWLRMKEML
ncbi:reverse transcriptase domain-containing protein [Tanacetum coccineum]